MEDQEFKTYPCCMTRLSQQWKAATNVQKERKKRKRMKEIIAAGGPKLFCGGGRMEDGVELE